MKYYIALWCWLHGWRQDLDGWWVRALRQEDIHVLGENPLRGFHEEACVAVKTQRDAYMLDNGVSI